MLSNGQIIQKENQQGNFGLGPYFRPNIYIYLTFSSTAAEYTFFSNAHRTLSRIHHMIGQKTGLSNFKTVEIIPSIFSDHSNIKLEINFVHSNKLINKIKRQLTEWEKIFANHMYDKELISKIYKQFIQFNIKRKWQKT